MRSGISFLAAVEKAAASGSLEIVETEDGELVAVDRDGSFYATANSTGFAENKPSKAAIDRLVNDQRKADEVAARKRAEREDLLHRDHLCCCLHRSRPRRTASQGLLYSRWSMRPESQWEIGTRRTKKFK